MSRIASIRQAPAKLNIVRNVKLRNMWASTKPWCYFCGTNFHVETHHIVGGSGKRSDEPCNFVRACESCHRRIHGTEKPKIPLIHVLTTKQANDPQEYDFKRLQEIHGSKWLLEEAI